MKFVATVLGFFAMVATALAEEAAAGADAGAGAGAGAGKTGQENVYSKRESIGIDLGGGRNVSVPFPILLLFAAAFLGAAGFLVNKLLTLEEEQSTYSTLWF